MAESVIKNYFPSQLEDTTTKLGSNYGKEVARAIEQEWFKKDGGTGKFATNQTEFHSLRLYARGEQSIQKYKNELAIDGDLSYLNLDWKIVPIIPKFVDIIVNGITERQFKIKAYSVDEFGVNKKTKYMQSVLRDMNTKEITEFAEQAMGISLAENDPSTLPANQDEFELHMMMDYKDTAEVAEEVSMSKILGDNKYSQTYSQIVYDLTTIGIGGAKERFSNKEGIKVEHVDPANMVWSYTECPNFSDIYYVGEVKTLNVNQVQKMFPKLTKRDIEKILQQGVKNGQYREMDSNSVQLLFFEYKTMVEAVYKIKTTSTGAEKAIPKDASFQPPQELTGDYSRVAESYETIMEGVYVIGSDTMLKWEQKENQIRPKSGTEETKFSYQLCAPRMYKGKIESTVGRITGFANSIQLTHLKMQQVLSRMTPDGIYIDADGLQDVDLGNGTNYNPAEAVKMYFQTGSVVGRSYTGDMDQNAAKIPIQEIQTSAGGNKLQSLITSYNFYLQMIRDATGLNEARDGSMPDERTLVGVQKMAAANSNTATRHIREGALNITSGLVDSLCLRLSDVLEYSPMKQEWINSIGANNVSILEELSELHLRDFGILIELMPDEEEKAVLEQNIQIALSKGTIEVDDAIDIREVRNLKMANQVLKLAKKKRAERAQAEKEALIAAQAKSNAQAQQVAAQAEVQKAQALFQIDSKLEQLRGQLKEKEIKTEKEAKKELMMLEFQLNQQLQGSQGEPTNKDKYMEDRKDNREGMKQKPKGFESAGNDTMSGGLSMGQFEPK